MTDARTEPSLRAWLVEQQERAEAERDSCCDIDYADVSDFANGRAMAFQEAISELNRREAEPTVVHAVFFSSFDWEWMVKVFSDKDKANDYAEEWNTHVKYWEYGDHGFQVREFQVDGDPVWEFTLSPTGAPGVAAVESAAKGGV